MLDAVNSDFLLTREGDSLSRRVLILTIILGVVNLWKQSNFLNQV